MKIAIQRWWACLLLVILISSVTLVGCSSQTTDAPESADEPIENTTSIAGEASFNPMKDYLPRLDGKAIVEMTVNDSPITIELNGEDAPITAGNFADLVEQGFYDGLVFHRVIKSPDPFVAQGGDPKGNGTGGFIDPETKGQRYIPLEIKLKGDEEPTYSTALGRQAGKSGPPVVLPHTRGAIAMARSQAPDSASSQFYFALADLAFLDGDYGVFGYVTSGMDVVDGIEEGDVIQKATIIEGKENLKR